MTKGFACELTLEEICFNEKRKVEAKPCGFFASLKNTLSSPISILRIHS